jgi:hypothetical protein
LKVIPEKIGNIVKVYCKKCNKSSFTSDYSNQDQSSGNYLCKHCKTGEECKLYHNAELICRENTLSYETMKIFLSTFDEEGENFFGLKSTNLNKNKMEHDKLGEILEGLTNPNAMCSVMVEANGPCLRIVGKYDFNLNLKY